MRKVILNCEELKERKKAHQYLAQMLDFPDYYGKNLDALFDCLTELGECTIVLEGGVALRQADGYGAKIIRVLEEAAQANPGLKIEMWGEGAFEAEAEVWKPMY